VDDETLVGKWAVCGIGRIGKITGRKTLDWGESWVGVGLDGMLWASRDPQVLADRDQGLIERLAGQDA
jgi:hypothetical protein